MKVFGIGLSKTGTKSLNAALRRLDYDVRHYPSDLATAREVVTRRPYSILARCDGLTDLHAAVRFRALDAKYPGSKFVLTIREKRAWLVSCRRHFEVHRPQTMREPLRSMVLCLRHRAYGDVQFDGKQFARAYDRHVASVLAHFVGRGDLLVIDIPAGDGWDKLCPFFEKPRPDEPFPFIR
jgi:hypothetical protein